MLYEWGKSNVFIMSDKVKTQPSSARPFAVIVLAAGKGTRMRSDLPKVLHPVAGKPMLGHVLSSAANLKPERMIVVVAKGMDTVRDAAKAAYPTCLFSIQDEKKNGTGAAVLAALEHLKGYAGDVLILFGDTPLITSETLQRMLESFDSRNQPVVTVLGMTPADPAEYGRLVINSKYELEEIVEFKDASPVQKAIMLCNSGVLAVKDGMLQTLLPEVSNKNAKGEYYLTDLVKIARSKGMNCAVIEAKEAELLGVNSREQLAAAEAQLQRRLRVRAMEQGATLVAPDTVFFSDDTEVSADVMIHPYVIFGSGVKIGPRVEIKAFSHIEGATISSDAIIGPYARLRPGAQIGEAAHVGNFVEVKKSVLEKGVKANHLTYIGDAYIGAGTNIGAGTITCNYDGFDKHETHIGANVLVGSNTSLVAPVSVGDGAIIGAGSVIVDDVEGDALALTRPSQHQKKDWGKTFRAGKKSKK